MAINRFRKFLPTLDPTMYQYGAQDYVPDLSKLGAVTTGLQSAYDASKNIPVPQHIQTEPEMAAVRDSYVVPMQNMRNEAVDAFTTGDLANGITKLKDLQQHIFESKQPGGKYYQFEQNYGAYQNYQKELQERYAKGDISSEKRDTLLRISRGNFTSSFAPTGEFVPFQGITASADVDLADKAIKQAQGWRASQVASGALVRGPNGYLSAVTKKYVDPKEVMDAIATSLTTDPATMAYLRQEAVMRGLSGDQATQYINDSIRQAAAVAAAKEGFTEVDTKFYKDWELEQQRKHAHEDAKDQGTRLTSYMQINTGGNPLELNKDGYLKENVVAYSPGGFGTFGRPTNVEYDKTKPGGIDAAYKEKGAALEQAHPGIGEVVKLVPRIVQDEQGKNRVRSDKEYNQAVAEAYNSWLQTRNQQYVAFERFNDQQIKRATNELFGEGGAPGNAPYMTYYLSAPGKDLQPVSYKRLLEITGSKDAKELRTKSSVTGELDPKNPVSPSGYTVTIGNGKKVFEVIASATTEEQRNQNEPIWNLAAPLRSLSDKESNIQVWNYGKSADNPNDPGFAILRSQRVMGLDENGKVREGLQLYQAMDVDEQGNPTDWQISPISFEQLISANRQLSPYRETVLNKRME